MALIRFETNAGIPDDKIKVITQNLSKAVGRITGEPTTEISVEMAGNRQMRMALSDEPLAHVEIRNVEIPKDRARELTQAICPVLEDAMAIPEHHVYIAVISNRNSMWRVNGDLS